MTSRMLKPLMLMLAFLSLATFVSAEEIIVLYRPGFPDSVAPAQIFEHQGNARMVSCLDAKALSEVMEKGGYKKIIAFDTFLEPEKLNSLKERLLELDSSTTLTIFVKKGDRSYDQLLCSERTTVDFKTGSYLLPVMESNNTPHTKGAELLDNGLSHCPTVDGKAMREFYATRECTAQTLFEIIEADAEKLQKLLESGHHFVEKLLSQTKLLVNTAKYETLAENNMRIGFQIAATGISTLGPAIIKSGNADIVIVLTETDPFSGEHRYSLRVIEKYSARRIYEFINSKTEVIRGGGDDVGAGLTCKATPQEIIALLKTASFDDITREHSL